MPWAVLVGNVLLWWCTVSGSGPGGRTNRWRSHEAASATVSGYKINPKPCRVDSKEGTCMFVFECIKSGGVHVGMCVEAFMFGSCCAPRNSTSSGGTEEHFEQPQVLFTASTNSEVVIRPSSQHSSHTGAGRPSSLETTMPANPTYYSSKHSLRPMSTDEGNVAIAGPSAAWQFTTEPDFITKVKRPNSHKPAEPNKPTKKPVHNLSKYSLKPVKATASTTTTTTTSNFDGFSQSISMSTTSFDNLIEDQNLRKFECGIPKMFSKAQTRIVGGKNAPFGKWPWQVSVRRTSFFGFSSTHRCGGAILSEIWIATAGHCVDDLLTSQIRIRVGEYDFSTVQESYPYVERSVTRKVVHPKYNFSTYEYDLALVQLEKELDFAPHISPICLPPSDDSLVGHNGTVTGWGRLSEGGTLPSVLQEVQVPIVSNNYCKSMFLRAGRHEIIPDVFLCAGHEGGGRDSCQGDSGGPLQVKGQDGRYFLAGIISWGIGCAEANLPGVCTRISKFVPWILKYVT